MTIFTAAASGTVGRRADLGTGGPAVAVASTFAAVAAVVAVGGLLLLSVRDSDLAMVLAVVTAAGLVAVPVVGRTVLRSDRRSKLGWLLLLAGTATVVKLVFDAYARAHFVDHASLPDPAVAEFVSSIATTGQLALAGLAPLLLSGRLPAGRWWRVCVAGTFTIMAMSFVSAFSPTFGHFDGVRNPFGVRGGWGQGIDGLSILVFVGQNVVDVSAALAVGAAIAQLPPGTSASTRRGLVVLHRAAWSVAAGFLLCLVLGSVGQADLAHVVEHLALLVFAVCAWVAIARFGLFDARQVLERTIRYGLLTAVVVAAYIVIVNVVRGVVGGSVTAVPAVAVAAVVGLLLRDLAQNWVAHLVWGPISDPAAGLEHLRSRLDGAARPQDVLVVTAHTLRETLGLAGVRVVDVHHSVLADSGEGDRGASVSLPLTFAGAPVGALIVTPQTGDVGLSGRQRALLKGVVSQLAAAVQAIAAGEDLSASQRRLASLRDSERNRIRADLHDGLGPTLAGIAWGIERARDAARDDPPSAQATLGQLAIEARGVVSEVRRLVHDLVPTRLEEIGLVAALTHDAEALGASIEVDDACWELPIPTTIELAAYRIGLEAATNVSRHADAANLTVRLAMIDARALVVEVEDDGRGIPAFATAGVGLASMRQRAEGCGGTLDIGAASPTGTIVRAVLPLTADHTFAVTEFGAALDVHGFATPRPTRPIQIRQQA